MREIPLDPDTLRRLYHDENKTMDEIAAMLECTKSTISAKFHQYGIKARSRRVDIPKKVLEERYVKNEESAESIAGDLGTSISLVCKRLKEYGLPVRGNRIPIPVSRDELEGMYIGQNMTIQQISDKTGVSKNLVHANLKRLDIPLRPDNSARRVNNIPKKDLEDMYVRQVCHVDEIGKKFGVSKYAVYRQLAEYGIPRRRTRTIQRTTISKETLKCMHLDEEMSAAQIARELNCSQVTVWQKLRKHGIRVRGRNLDRVLTKDRLVRLYDKEKKSAKELGRMFKCDPATIHAYRRKFGIPVHRDYSRPEYEEKRRLRNLGMERLAEMRRWLGNKCQVCGRTERLSVHHMWYLQSGDTTYKKYPRGAKYLYHIALYPIVRSDTDRFKLLCSPCHSIAGLFQSMEPESRRRMLAEIGTQNQLRVKYPTRYEDIARSAGK